MPFGTYCRKIVPEVALVLALVTSALSLIVILPAP